MKFRIFLYLLVITLIGSQSLISAQVDTVIGQITSSTAETFVGGISGDGRFVVFESTGNLATENPRNSDNNREIFLFDYAQRRVFQITDTKSLLIDPDSPASFNNIKVSIDNTRPTISNDGRWLVLSSNATTSTPAMPDATNPGSFDANAFTDADENNPLTQDGNMEIWLYQIPQPPPADLSSGAEIPVFNLSGGAFTRVTNTPPSRLPVAGTATTGPFVANDNADASISNDGNLIAFASTRDLVPAIGNAFPDVDNPEIFTYNRTTNMLGQITKTPRNANGLPVKNRNPTISGNGLRVVFTSNADDPIVNSATGNNFDTSQNTDGNFEVFVSDLEVSSGVLRTSVGGIKRQITTTAETNPGELVNVLNFGRRMSLDGNLIAFDSYADLANENGGSNQTGFALFLYNITDNSYRRIGPRSDADSEAFGGDVQRYPGFTDYNGSGVAQTIVLETRMNITPEGVIPADEDDGLNPVETRPAQIYSFPINVDPATATFTRLTKLPPGNTFVATTQPVPTNSSDRITFNLGLIDIGTGNFDQSTEAYYMLTPDIITENASRLDFETGATRRTIVNEPIPTPSPTPTPSPDPGPMTPTRVFGTSPGSLAVVNFSGSPPIQERTAIGSFERSFPLPIELSGVTMTINGASVGLKAVKTNEITFVVPRGLTTDPTDGRSFPVVINNNGDVIRGDLQIVVARPDIFTIQLTDPVTNNTLTNRADILNVTTRVFTREPFTVTTIPIRRGPREETILRLFLTGVESAPANLITIDVGDVEIFPTQLGPAVLRAPGIYSIDFIMPSGLNMAGEVPIMVTITFNGLTYESRLADTAPRFRIL